MQDAEKSVIFESFPPILYLQLMRYEYDIQKDAMVKVIIHFKGIYTTFDDKNSLLLTKLLLY